MKAAGTFAQSISQGAQWVREREQFAFINDGPALRHLANQPPCDLTTRKYHKYIFNASPSSCFVIRAKST